MYVCAVTCGQSFTVLSVWGVLISFFECFSVFSHPPLPFIIITLLSLLSLLLFLLLVITVVIIYIHRAPGSVGQVLGLGLSMAGGAHGCVAGRAGF